MSSKTKNILIVTGVSIVALGLGYYGYRMYRRWNKTVVEGKHNTILIEEINPDEVESVGWDEQDSGIAQKPMSEWTSEEEAVTSPEEVSMEEQLREWERYNLF